MTIVSTKSKTPSALSGDLGSGSRWNTLKQDLHRSLINAVDHKALREMDEAQVRRQLRIGAEELCRVRPDLLSPSDRNRLIDELVDETLGFGPLEQLLGDETISDILINGPHSVFVERHGKLEHAPIRFHDEEHLLQTVQKIVSRVGRRVDESSPMVDARLPDGSRVNAIIRPLALDGTLVSIRRRRAEVMQIDDLVESGSLSPTMVEFLIACIAAKANLLIAGGTGSGKTTLLNALSSHIPPGERVVTIEDAAELCLQQPHVARLETRPPNLEGTGQVTTRDLLRNALRMRPDRIIIGECRGGEAFDMLQAMNTGHSGSMTTLHANSASDAINRLEMLAGMSGIDITPHQICRQICSAINVVVHLSRLTDGSRKVMQISELGGIVDGAIQIRDLFTFAECGTDDDGVIRGEFVAHKCDAHIEHLFHAKGIRVCSSGVSDHTSETCL